MTAKAVSDRLRVSGQIGISDIAEAAKLGVRVIVCNRPENETPDQPPTADLIAASAEHGIDFRHIPVESGAITDEDVGKFRNVIREADGLVWAYCRSGMRSVSLWALSEAESLGCELVLQCAVDAGYDLDALRPRLDGVSDDS